MASLLSCASYILVLALACPHSSHAFSPSARTLGAAATASTSWTSTLHVSLQQLDDSNMQDLLFRPSEGKKAVLVDAYAPWCGPCKLIEPYLEECAKKYSDQLSVIKYDVEGNNNKNLKVEMLLQGVMVRGLPTLLLYNDGVPLASHSGAITESDLETWLEENFNELNNMNNSKQDEQKEQMVSLEENVETDEASSGGKRGFVSFAFGRDDYAL